MDLQLPHQKHYPLGYQALLVSMLQSILFQQQALLRSESNRENSKMKNESVKKSLEKSKNVQEKLKNRQAKNVHKKDQQVHNNCYELRLRAIKHSLGLNSPMRCYFPGFGRLRLK